MGAKLTLASPVESDDNSSDSEICTPLFDTDMKSSALIHPHVGNNYFTGNNYEHPWRASNEAAAKDRSTRCTARVSTQWVALANGSSNYSGTYVQYVRALSWSWLRLLYLVEFMEASTVPAKAKLLSIHEKTERWNRVKASVLSFSNLQDIERKDCASLEDLSKLLNNPENNIKPNRLIISEDYSSGLIELLGSHFDVDPHFFRGHIEDHTWFNTKDPWVELPEADSTLKKRSFSNIRYVQA